MASGGKEYGTTDPHLIRYSALLRNYNEIPTFPRRESYVDVHTSLRRETQVVSFHGGGADPYRPSSVPIYQTATFVQPSSVKFGAYDYSRSGNPTRTALEKAAALLEQAYATFAFSTGMAAISTVMRLVDTGEEIVVCADAYGGTVRLLSKVLPRFGIRAKFVDTGDLDAVEKALKEGEGRVRLIHVESPSNPLMRITDIRSLSKLGHAHGALVSVDSTMMSPLRMRPLMLGADLVCVSLTKFFSGHSDANGGLVAVRDEALAKRVAFVQNAEGTALAPFESWLMLRGIKTMAIRMDRAESNAHHVALFLQRHPRVTKVFYCGLPPLSAAEHKALIQAKRAALSNAEAGRLAMEGGKGGSGEDGVGELRRVLGADEREVHVMPSDEELRAEAEREAEAHRIHSSQASGAGSVLSFTTGSVVLSRRIVDALRLFKLTVSFGSVHSLAELPCTLSHASVPAEQRTLPPDLIRLSIGVEHVEDLLADLSNAFELATNAAVPNVRAVARQVSDDALADEDEVEASTPTPTTPAPKPSTLHPVAPSPSKPTSPTQTPPSPPHPPLPLPPTSQPQYTHLRDLLLATIVGVGVGFALGQMWRLERKKN